MGKLATTWAPEGGLLAANGSVVLLGGANSTNEVLGAARAVPATGASCRRLSRPGHPGATHAQDRRHLWLNCCISSPTSCHLVQRMWRWPSNWMICGEPSML